jgi:hypothetical protein
VSALTTTTQKWGVLTGNPYAPLADEPEEEATPIQRRRQQKGPEHGRGWSVREEEPGAREAPDRKGDSGHQKTTYRRAVHCDEGSAKGGLQTDWFMTKKEMGRRERRRIG